ncbi:hypothetical protein JMJ77_0009328 [Colletotrichum scovillei]|uniref:Uncharacterized protein n=1 Tax=Colletotrichum scovillei TaxID=1209932 RepID=A0A9P7R115_9PEZI|nr:hypothetical protein JMJ77_0009328 [Colletotrichum scovillei]KAG7052406.1 hypothetical protein JMJ78_0005424 [Colletotrichum scovillei]
MHISPPVSGSPLSTLSLFLLLLSNTVLGSTLTTPTPTTTTTQNQKNEPAAPPNRAYEAPLLTITPAPDSSAVSRRLLRARQGDPRSSDGRTNFIACGPSNTCDTITMLQTQGSTDARRIIFCIAMSELYVLPMTWYRVTHPLPEASVATVTVTQSTTVTATPGVGGSRMSGQASTPSCSPPAMMALSVAAMISFLALIIP